MDTAAKGTSLEKFWMRVNVSWMLLQLAIFTDGTPKMTIRERIHDLLPLLANPLSLIEQARAGCLPPALPVSAIAALWSSDGKYPQESIEIILKTAIKLGELVPLAANEWSRIVTEFESSRDTERYTERDGNHLPTPKLIMTGYLGSDVVVNPPNHILSADIYDDCGLRSQVPEGSTPDRSKDPIFLYVVHKTEMKNWLEKEKEWPLPQECLLSRWWVEQYAEYYAGKTQEKIGEAENTLRREKEYWRVHFRGRAYTIKQSVGMQYITHLIEMAYTKEQEIHVSDLYYLIHKRPIAQDTALSRMTREQLSELGLDVSSIGGGLDLMTPEAKQWAGRQVRELERLMEEAEDEGNTNEALRLRESKEALEDHIQKALGLSGRVRKDSDPNERMRKTVSKAIANTLEKLGKKDGDELAVYLDDHLETGLFCSFRKDPNIFWKIVEK